MVSNRSIYDYLEQIKRIGFFGFVHELIGLGELDREKASTELALRDLSRQYETLTVEFQKLQNDNQQLRAQLKQEHTKQAKIEEEKRNLRYERLRLLQPPSAFSVFKICNIENWFSRFTIEKGVIHMYHTRQFYPCDKILISMGELRLCDQYGNPVNLAQNYAYNTLPAREYAQAFIPSKLQAVRMRVLFGTDSEDGFWLQNPLCAQDLIIEIRAYEADEKLSEEELLDWNKQNPTRKMLWAGGQYITTQIVAFAQLLNNSRRGGYSQDILERIRERCYAEYSELYFHDGSWD